MDWADVDFPTALSASGQDFVVTLPDTYTLKFNLRIATNYSWASTLLRTFDIPGATNGTANQFAITYPSLPGKISLGSVQGTSTPAPSDNSGMKPTKVFTYYISNIQLSSSDGVLGGYSFLIADAERTTSSNTGLALAEQWIINSDKNISIFATLATNPAAQPACGGGLSGVDTTTVKCIGGGTTGATQALIFGVGNAQNISLDSYKGLVESGNLWYADGTQHFAFAVNLGDLYLQKPPVADGGEDAIYVGDKTEFFANPRSTGEIVSGRVVSQPRAGLATVSLKDGKVHFASGDAAPGIYEFDVIWADDLGQSVTSHYKVTVLERPQKPTVPKPPETGIIIASGSVIGILLIGLAAMFFARKLSKARK